MSITVIIPTLNRHSLTATLSSVHPQLQPEDQLIVISETHNPSVWTQVEALGGSYLSRKGGDWGHANRNYALDFHVKTTHVWTLDDDDVALPGALDAMREHINDPWTIFRMRFGNGHPAAGSSLPNGQRFAHGYIGTPMIFAPLTEARFGPHYSGDWDYACQLKNVLGEPAWADHTVCEVRPIRRIPV